MKRSSMDRFIDTIEWIAAAFVGLVALDIFVSVLLRNLFNYAVPDSFRRRACLKIPEGRVVRT